MSDLVRVNFGCAYAPLPGWINCDNSLTLKMSGIPVLPDLLYRLGVISQSRWAHIQLLRRARVLCVDALKRLPFSDSSVDVIYTSHMINCFDRADARAFLSEAHRILKAHGTIRIAVPDLRKKVDAYIAGGDADSFIESIYARRLTPKRLGDRVEAFLSGYKLYLAQDDACSLTLLLLEAGFANVTALSPGQTRIQESSGLDLFEHAEESLYVEASKA